MQHQKQTQYSMLQIKTYFQKYLSTIAIFIIIFQLFLTSISEGITTLSEETTQRKHTYITPSSSQTINFPSLLTNQLLRLKTSYTFTVCLYLDFLCSYLRVFLVFLAYSYIISSNYSYLIIIIWYLSIVLRWGIIYIIYVFLTIVLIFVAMFITTFRTFQLVRFSEIPKECEFNTR